MSLQYFGGLLRRPEADIPHYISVIIIAALYRIITSFLEKSKLTIWGILEEGNYYSLRLVARVVLLNGNHVT